MALTQVPLNMLDPAAGDFGFRNRIINGAMMVSQRGTSFSTPATGSYTLDRWQLVWGGAAPASVAQVAGPSGFKNALQITGAASNTITYVVHKIESANCSDLSGATVTIQVNIAVSSAQTIVWNLNYANATDNFSSITGITSGTWSATSTPTTFTATITNLPSGAVNGLQLGIYANNAGAFTSGTLTITGVQLEKGSTATPFEFRPYGVEALLCYRYYWRYVPENANEIIEVGQNETTTRSKPIIKTPVPMRVAPTVSTSGAATFNLRGATTNVTCSSFSSAVSQGPSRIAIEANTATAHGGVAGGAAFFCANTTSSWFDASSEL